MPRSCSRFGLVAGSGAQASSARHDAENDKIVCNNVRDTVSITPPLINGGTASSVVLKLTAAHLAGCSVTDSADVPVAITITGQVSGKLRIAGPNANDCANLVGPLTVTGDELPVTWTADPTLKVKTSKVTFTSITGAPIGVANAVYADFSSNSGISVRHVFTGGDNGASSSLELVTTDDITSILSRCATSGVKSVTIGFGQLKLG